jgi:hypothetical protein
MHVFETIKKIEISRIARKEFGDWPVRSSDLTSLDFFLGCIKERLRAATIGQLKEESGMK